MIMRAMALTVALTSGSAAVVRYAADAEKLIGPCVIYWELKQGWRLKSGQAVINSTLIPNAWQCSPPQAVYAAPIDPETRSVVRDPATGVPPTIPITWIDEPGRLGATHILPSLPGPNDKGPWCVHTSSAHKAVQLLVRHTRYTQMTLNYGEIDLTALPVTDDPAIEAHCRVE